MMLIRMQKLYPDVFFKEVKRCDTKILKKGLPMG